MLSVPMRRVREGICKQIYPIRMTEDHLSGLESSNKDGITISVLFMIGFFSNSHNTCIYLISPNILTNN